ncbi:MAG TPA: hypothetical protein VGQ94_05480 [Terriglobales bacterium]|nr:hypothetical protein [Terriglobales bacterium]
MGAVIFLLALALYLVSVVCWILILIHAFKTGGALHGILCFCFWPYAVYWGFAKFEHPKKNLILGGFLGGIVAGFALQFLAIFMATQK